MVTLHHASREGFSHPTHTAPAAPARPLVVPIPRLKPPNADWSFLDRAACGPADIDLFHLHNDSNDTARIDAARRVCAGCPVIDACRTYGIAEQTRHSYTEPLGMIYGGLSPAEIMRAVLDARNRDRRAARAAAR